MLYSIKNLYNCLFVLQILQITLTTAGLHQSCGPPGRSKGLFVRPQLRKYLDQQTVEYGCRKAGQVLLGPSIRQCVQGRWQQVIPKCGENEKSVN